MRSDHLVLNWNQRSKVAALRRISHHHHHVIRYSTLRDEYTFWCFKVISPTSPDSGPRMNREPSDVTGCDTSGGGECYFVGESEVLHYVLQHAQHITLARPFEERWEKKQRKARVDVSFGVIVMMRCFVLVWFIWFCVICRRNSVCSRERERAMRHLQHQWRKLIFEPKWFRWPSFGCQIVISFRYQRYSVRPHRLSENAF